MADDAIPNQEDPAVVPLDVPLPEVTTSLSPAEVVARLDAMARRGKLAGFEPVPGSPGAVGTDLFAADAFGGPYDGIVIASVDAIGQGGTTLSFRARMKPVLPWVWGVVLVLTAWPGVVVTESMLATMFPTWKWLWGTTWWWYLPLTVPFIPWVLWTTVRKSRAAIHDSAHRVIAGVAAETGGTIKATG